MKLLLIAPSAVLNTTQELITAMSGMNVVVLTDPVTLREVLSQISTDSFDGIHFAGDSSTTLLSFAGGASGIALLTAAFNRATNLKFVVLNSCSSLALAAEIYTSSTSLETIGWPKDVLDEVAQAWAVAFYQALRISDNVTDSAAVANEMIAAQFPGTQKVNILNGRLAVSNAAVVAAHLVTRNAVAAAEKVKVAATVEAEAIRLDAKTALEKLAQTEAARSRGSVPFWLAVIMLVAIIVLVILLAWNLEIFGPVL